MFIYYSGSDHFSSEARGAGPRRTGRAAAPMVTQTRRLARCRRRRRRGGRDLFSNQLDVQFFAGDLSIISV